MNKAMQETTLATQADFHPENLLTGAMVSGTHPIGKAGGLLNRVWYLFDLAQRGEINTARVQEIAASLPNLRQIVEQYIDPATGKPRAECADGVVVAMKEETACFGRKCGFANGCFFHCSLGPSHSQDGKPLGVEGQAAAYNTAGQPLGPETYSGVLKVDHETGKPLTPPRHRDNSCITLSLFLRLIGVPPAPTSALGDALWDALPQALTAVEQGLQAQPLPTPQAAAPKPAAPPAVAPLPPQPAAHSQQPAMQQPAPTPAPVQKPATPPSGHALAPIFPGIDLTYDQQCELHALMYVLEHTPNKPKSAESIKKMEQRHVAAKKTPKAVIAAWRGPAEDRQMMVGTGINARLKPEFWPPHIPQPANYYAIEEVAPPAQPQRTPAEQALAGPPTVAMQPQAPTQPQQKIDRDENTPAVNTPYGGPVDIRTVTLDTESKEALKEHTDAMNNLAAALRGVTFPGAGQPAVGGNPIGNHQSVHAPAAVPHQPAQVPTPAGPPAVTAGGPPAPTPPGYPAAPAPGNGGFQPPSAPIAPPPGFRNYGVPAPIAAPVVDTGNGQQAVR